jgi:hypothetical protein
MDTRDDYQQELEYLLEYARQDWLGFSVISGTVGSLLGKGAPWSELRSLTLRIVVDLYRDGARPGALTASDSHPIGYWNTDEAGLVRKIDQALEAKGELPDSGDICWFTVPSAEEIATLPFLRSG